MLSSLFLNRVSIDPSAVGGVEVAVVVINQSQLVVRVLTGKSEFIGMERVSFCRKHASEGRVFVARLSFMLFPEDTSDVFQCIMHEVEVLFYFYPFLFPACHHQEARGYRLCGVPYVVLYQHWLWMHQIQFGHLQVTPV